MTVNLFPRSVFEMPLFYCIFLNLINKCSKTIILKHLKDVGFCNIDCGHVNIPDKLRHSKRHIMQSSFSFSFNNQENFSLNTCFIDVLYRHIVYHNRSFFIPKIIVVNDLLKLSLNSYAAKDTICVLFLTKKTQNYRYRNYCPWWQEFNLTRLYSYDLLCEPVLSMHTA